MPPATSSASPAKIGARDRFFACHGGIDSVDFGASRRAGAFDGRFDFETGASSPAAGAFEGRREVRFSLGASPSFGIARREDGGRETGASSSVVSRTTRGLRGAA